MIRIIFGLVSLMALASGFADVAPPEEAASRVVIEFNAAVTRRDMDAAIPLLAEGGVEFSLHPAHPGMPADPPLTADMISSWKVVSSILFPSTERYERNVVITDVKVSSELAVVWTQTKTVTHMKNKAEPMVLEFSEMYFLVNKNNEGWQIAGTANNRPVDSINVGQEGLTNTPPADAR